MPERVLVIEFDPLMRSLLTEWLEELGMQVLAQARADALPARAPGLVIVDLVNPRQVRQARLVAVEQLRQRYPGVPVLGLSTLASEGVAADSRAALALGLDMLLPKPCTRQTLTGAVRTLVHAERP
jgi:CheY-like chemotaxis protein